MNDPLTAETVTQPLNHAEELRRLAAMEAASWDYVQAAMRSAADELDRRWKLYEMAVRGRREFRQLVREMRDRMEKIP